MTLSKLANADVIYQWVHPVENSCHDIAFVPSSVYAAAGVEPDQVVGLDISRSHMAVV